VSLSPDSAAAKIALSYAQQAAFDIPGARDTLQQAVAQQPDDALAWARLAELQLMLGERTQSRESAQRATSLDPNLSRTQMTLGFAALAEFRNDEARAAFERAIELDPADPLPHLGLGLAKISAGDLEAGRGDIEVAVGLGSSDALLRAYLGKSYFEEKRAPLDIEQFDMAKQLDPNDPTAFLYSGIALQTENRPVEAARDLEKSVELNDNRATYRGRLLLDKDRAARGTSLARAYNDTGFKELGVNQSTESLTLDPANSSAHRFLSDTYRGQRRRELSRVSELYQAQMMQDININPIQPSISSTNLNIVTLGGPANPGFNEFTPLFQQNQTQFDMSGFAGNNGTHGGEAVLTTLHDRYSLSLGGMHYFTDGYRDNNDLRHKIYTAFGQADLTPTLNIQGEYSYRDSKNGDLAQNFDANDFNPQLQRDFKDKTARLGARFTPNETSSFLVSFIYSDRDEEVDQGTEVLTFPCGALPPNWPFPCDGSFTVSESRDDTVDDTTYQYEGQYIRKGNLYNLVAGGGYATADQKIERNITSTISFPLPPSVTGEDDKVDIDNWRGYAYSNITPIDNMVVTVGMSYEDYDEAGIDFDQFNPKLGLQWNLTDTLKLRAAYFKAIKPALANNRTLEPTQVAGFNQFYDDANATKSKRFGGALEWKITDKLSMGGELTRRKIDAPIFLGSVNDATFEDQDEWNHRAYAYWAPADRWGFSAEAVYDKFESEDSVDPDLPTEVRTWSFPVAAQYFHPSGYFGMAGLTYVDQDVSRQAVSQYSEGDDNFTVTDLAVGYRLPRRQGIVSFAVQNVFDKEFDFQDDSYRTFEDEPSIGPYIPDRTFMARFTLNF
jgi:tetratricopeptide (TPR) repeat protein